MTAEFRETYKNVEIIVLKGDITEVSADAIVNAANKYLKHGGGVAAAIVQKGGEIIQKESNKIIAERGPLEVGEAVATSAGKLPAKHVIHTVGPIYGEGDEKNKLIKAVWSSLKLAEELGDTSIAFPAISTGVYRVPPELAADAMVDGVLSYIDRNPSTIIRKIILVLYTASLYETFLSVLKYKVRSRRAPQE